jgi:hypothetical protein
MKPLILSGGTSPDGNKDRNMVSPQHAPPEDADLMNQPQRPRLPIHIYPHGILLLSPLIFVVTVAILLGLLGIFVAWLLIVAVLVSAIVASDLAERSLRRLFKAHGRALHHRAAGYP